MAFQPTPKPHTLLLPVSSKGEEHPKTYADKLEVRMREIHKMVREYGQKADFESKRREDEKRGTPSFQAGDEVMCQRFRLGGEEGEARKQDYKYDGPFIIGEILCPSTAKLKGLLRGSPIAINVQYLRKYLRLPAAEGLRATTPPPQATEDQEEPKWEVEEIRAQRTQGRRKEYLLKWKGYPRLTWVPKKDLTGCEELLEEFHRRNGTSA